MSDRKIGPLEACAYGDAYGAGLEYASPHRVHILNDLAGYIQHHKWKGIKPGCYTDDTQMALALSEFMMSGHEWSFLNIASAWVDTFHRDPHEGYAGRFWEFLKGTKTGADFLKNIRPHSSKSGGAMRAFPCGFLSNPRKVRDRAMFQASTTHATMDGMRAAAGAALMFHYCYHNLGPKVGMPMFLDKWVPGCQFSVPWHGKVGSPGLESTRAAVTSVVANNSLAEVLRSSVAWVGDVDTVAAIAMPAAATCLEVENTLPQVLIDGLENGAFGRDYLIQIDRMLTTMHPPQYMVQATRDAAQAALKAELKAELNSRQAVKPEISEDNPIALLFQDD